MSSKQNRFRLGALVLALALVVGACGGGGKSKDVSADKSGRTTTTSSTDNTDVSLDTGSSTTNAGGATATTTKKGGSSGTTAKSGSSGSGGGGGGTDPNAVPSPAKVGTYGYSQSGTTPDGPVPPNGTLDVSGGPTQQFSRYYDPSRPPLTLTYDFRSDAPYITAATMTMKGATVMCTFGNGVPVPPWPPTPGKTFSGSGTCSSPIGPLAATIAGSVTSRNGDLVGIATNVHVNNPPNSVSVTLHDTEQWAISLRVPRSSHQTFDGSAFGQPITGDVTSTLTSTP